MSSAASSKKEVSHEKKLFGQIEVPEFVITAGKYLLQIVLFSYALYNAYRIRTYAIRDYGEVIHEFDPWFNFRATQYLSDNGWHKFFHWFDYMSWYPLGRPVGTTIYPGLQITAVAIHRAAKMLGYPMSLTTVCCYMPCWFGSVATFFTALMAYEATASTGTATLTALIMAIIPAHMMRSVGGGFDNESIAITAIVMTFYFWMRSLRHPGISSWGFGLFAGLAYGYMVAAWGGFIFVLNMVAFHAAATVAVDTWYNRWENRVVYSYSLFYVIGTAIATTVPPVGMMPFKSLEQLFALVVFVVLWILWFAEGARKHARLEVWSKECFQLRLKYLGAAGAAAMGVVAVVVPGGFFGPLSSRVRGLFLQHTRTGNPLVDSVAEHQPASPDAYWQYLHLCSYFWHVGMVTMPMFAKHRHNAAIFLTCYSFIAYFFSLKMARLIILSGPVASCEAAYCFAAILRWTQDQLFWSESDRVHEAEAQKKIDEVTAKKKNLNIFETLKLNYRAGRTARVTIASIIFACVLFNIHWGAFNYHCERLAHSFANPQIMFRSQDAQGRTVMIDDYRESYFWLRDNTPEDARVLSWWDYGYQITGIGNRTTLADGNTWNHEHIATIGYMLTSPVPRAHGLIRHVADYVLVWGGQGGDDLAKSPHMARIGNSVYRDICPKDPLCTHFGFEGGQGQGDYSKPTKMMRNSLLYNLISHNQRPGVRVDTKFFTEAFTSKHGLVRIFKTSNIDESTKKWLADPANRDCDAPGSWYCNGKYPTHVQTWKELLAKRVDFAQLEDFNKKGKGDAEYQSQYAARMSQFQRG